MRILIIVTLVLSSLGLTGCAAGQASSSDDDQTVTVRITGEDADKVRIRTTGVPIEENDFEVTLPYELTFERDGRFEFQAQNVGLVTQLDCVVVKYGEEFQSRSGESQYGVSCGG